MEKKEIRFQVKLKQLEWIKDVYLQWIKFLQTVVIVELSATVGVFYKKDLVFGLGGLVVGTILLSGLFFLQAEFGKVLKELDNLLEED